MQLKLKISDILLINKMLVDLKTTSMSGRVSYQITQYKKKLKPILDSFNETRDELIKNKYGVSDEIKKEMFTIPEEKMPAFLEEMQSVLDQEETIEVPSKFKIADFSDITVPGNFFEVMELVIEE